MEKPFRVSVVGCGNISKTHLPVLLSLDGVIISSVVDVIKEKADIAATEYSCRAFYDYETMLCEDKPDCVHICTPHYLHVEMAEKALRAGVNVLCEKPLAITKESLRELRNVSKESEAVLGVCFQNRYNSAVVKAKKIIESKEFGNLIAGKGNVSWFRDKNYYSDDWHGKLLKEGGGVLVNQAIHTADLLRYLIGSKIKKVEAHVFDDSLSDLIEVEDTACVRCEFENGVLAILNATNAFSFNSEVTLDFYFESGDKLHIEGLDLYHMKPDGTVVKLTDETEINFHGKNYWGNGHYALIKDFYDCLSRKENFWIDADEGGLATEEFLASYESSERQRAVTVDYSN